MPAQPSRGEVWEVDLSPSRGNEQAGKRPGLIVSTDRFNHGPAGLVILMPMTTVDKRVPLHVEVDPPEGEVRRRSFVKPEDIRSVSRERLGKRLGSVSPRTIATVEDRLRVLVEL